MHRYRVMSITGTRATRSLEGSGAVLLVGSLAAIVGLLAAGVDPVDALRAGAAAGAAGAVVEAFSNHGMDNLTTQVVGAAAAFALL